MARRPLKPGTKLSISRSMARKLGPTRGYDSKTPYGGSRQMTPGSGPEGWKTLNANVGRDTRNGGSIGAGLTNRALKAGVPSRVRTKNAPKVKQGPFDNAASSRAAQIMRANSSARKAGSRRRDLSKAQNMGRKKRFLSDMPESTKQNVLGGAVKRLERTKGKARATSELRGAKRKAHESSQDNHLAVLRAAAGKKTVG